MPDKKLRLIHTSDTHLGDPAGHPESADALVSVVEAVAHNKGDMLLIVGDVFDNERVSDDVLEWFVKQIGQLDTPAVLLPGNHDLIHETSVYHREA
ncbi:MAG: metallophosphoesterase, partial [Chloroflexi bacterium]|nr:metallophosphoesterase [Chloroflexota bacterium]